MQSDTPSQSGADSASSLFRLQFMVKGGHNYIGGLYQYMTVLNIRGGDSPRCSMLITRHNGDLIGRPVGLFSEPLSPGRVTRLLDRLDAVDPTKLPKPTAGDVNASNLELNFQHGTRNLSCRYNARDMRFLTAIAPVMDELGTLMSELLTKPERALTVSVEKSGDTGMSTRLRLRLTNDGTGDVIVADPRIIVPTSPDPRAYLQVALMPPFVPGEMERPPRWQRVGLELPPIGVPDEGLTITPKGSLAILSVPWNAPGPGTYIAQAVWQDYLGPVKIDPFKGQAVVPKDADQSDRPLVARGAAFSGYQRFEMPGK